MLQALNTVVWLDAITTQMECMSFSGSFWKWSVLILCFLHQTAGGWLSLLGMHSCFCAMGLSWVLSHWSNQFAQQGLHSLPLSIKSGFNWQDQVAGAFLPIRQGAILAGGHHGACARETGGLRSRVQTAVTEHQHSPWG